MDIVWERGLTLRTGDGTTLVSDIWYPADHGRLPTLVVRTAYGREVASAVTAPHPSIFARAGYLVVSQDVRGRGDSGGVFDPFVHEAGDGADTIAWAAALAHSNGRVGMYGFSYQGMAQLYAAGSRPPALRAIAPAMCSSDPGEGFLRCGGALRLGFATSWAAQLSGADPFLGAAAAARLEERCAHGRVDEWRHWDDWERGECGPTVDVSALTIPALFTIGWYDTFALGGWRDFTAYRAGKWLIGGPWSHMPWSPGRDVVTAAHLAFFDEHLACRPTSTRAPVIRSLACGAGPQWQAWPDPPAVTPRYFGLLSDGDAASRFGDGALVEGPTLHPSPGAYCVHQPAVPVMAAGGAYAPGAGSLGQVDQREVQDRTDVLCFTGPVLEQPVELFGAARFTTRLTSAAPLDDVCVTLCEVTPSGAVHNLAFGARRGKGTVTVELSPVHALVGAGSRLRIAVAPSAYPEIDVNRSAGEFTTVTRILWPAESVVEVPVVDRG